MVNTLRTQVENAARMAFAPEEDEPLPAEARPMPAWAIVGALIAGLTPMAVIAAFLMWGLE